MKEVNDLNWQIMYKTKQRFKPLNDLDCILINYSKMMLNNDSGPRVIFLPVFGEFADLQSN